MKSIKSKTHTTVIKYACAILFLIASPGCAYENQKITGKVIGESGVALSGVSVTACYSGWGWSSGHLVWDKSYCSKPVLTDDYGLYVINFKGPDFIRLKAKKNGWIQTQDFNARDSQIILIRNEVYSSRMRAEASLHEKNFRKRASNESAREYYCRVILSRSRSINLDYQGGVTLSIVPILHKDDDHRDVFFAVKGETKATHSLVNEAVFRINGQTVNKNFSFRSGEKSCETDIHFIVSNISGLHLESDKRLEILVPSIRAMFDIQTWNLSAEQ